MSVARHSIHQKSRFQHSQRCRQHKCHCVSEQKNQAKHASVPTSPSHTTVQHTAAELRSNNVIKALTIFSHLQPQGVRYKVQNTFKLASKRNNSIKNNVDDTENARYYIFDHSYSTFPNNGQSFASRIKKQSTTLRSVYEKILGWIFRDDKSRRFFFHHVFHSVYPKFYR